MPLGDGYSCGCQASTPSWACPHKKTPNPAQYATEKVQPTKVWFVQGKEANKNFRSALALHRENATLQETDEHQDDSQQNKS